MSWWKGVGWTEDGVELGDRGRGNRHARESERKWKRPVNSQSIVVRCIWSIRTRLIFTSLLTASFFYAVAIMYGISDLSAVTSSNGSFPLAVVYSQATGSKGATFGLLLIIFLSIMICVLGTFLTARTNP